MSPLGKLFLTIHQFIIAPFFVGFSSVIGIGAGMEQQKHFCVCTNVKTNCYLNLGIFIVSKTLQATGTKLIST